MKRFDSSTLQNSPENSAKLAKADEPLAQSYHFYYVPLHPVVGSGSVAYDVSEVAACMNYLGTFLEQFTSQQVVVLTLPIEELEMFFSRLETILNLIKDKTG